MSAKDAVKAREQSKRRPVVVPIEQPAKAVEPVKAVETIVATAEWVEVPVDREETFSDEPEAEES